MEKEELNNLDIAWITLAKELIEKDNFGVSAACIDFNNENNRLKIQNIINYAKEEVWKAHEEFKIKSEGLDEVYCGDLVVLSIDDNEPERYYLSISSNHTKTIETKTRYYNVDFYTEINENSKVIYLILGKHVGDTITYTDDDDKKEHTIKILSIHKTKYSEKINEYEIKSYITHKKKLG